MSQENTSCNNEITEFIFQCTNLRSKELEKLIGTDAFRPHCKNKQINFKIIFFK